MKTRRTWSAAAAAACMLVAAPAWGHPHPDQPPPPEEILDGLERGIVALEQLDRGREADMLRRIAEEVRQEMQTRRVRAQVVEGQLEALHLAMPAFREQGRMEAIERTERAIHERELYLENRPGDSRRLQERGPRREECLELMELAADLYMQAGAPDRSERLRRLTDEFWRPRERERRRERAREGLAGDVEHRIEVTRLAIPALLEADRRDAAEALERAIHALEMDLQGRRDHEAAMIRNNAPGIGDQIEILQTASALWREYGHHERAVMVGELAEQLAAESRRGSGRRDRPRREMSEDDRRQLEQIQEQFIRLEQALEDLRRRLRDNERGR